MHQSILALFSVRTSIDLFKLLKNYFNYANLSWSFIYGEQNESQWKRCTQKRNSNRVNLSGKIK